MGRGAERTAAPRHSCRPHHDVDVTLIDGGPGVTQVCRSASLSGTCSVLVIASRRAVPWSKPTTASAVDRRCGVIRVPRLPPLLAFRGGAPPYRIGRQRRLLRRPPRPWPPDPPRATDVALGVVQSSDERLAPGAAPTTPTTPRVEDRHDGPARRSSRGSSVLPALLSLPAHPRSRRRLRDAGPIATDGFRRPGSPTPTSRVSTAASSCNRRARQPSRWRPSDADATALPPMRSCPR